MTCHMEHETRLKPHAPLHLPKPAVEQPCGCPLLWRPRNTPGASEKLGSQNPTPKAATDPGLTLQSHFQGTLRAILCYECKYHWSYKHRYNHVKFWFCKGIHLLMNKHFKMTPYPVGQQALFIVFIAPFTVPLAR